MDRNDRGPGREHRAGAGAWQGRAVPSGPAPTLLTRLRDWFTEEVPDEAAPDETAEDQRGRPSETAGRLEGAIPVPVGTRRDAEQASEGTSRPNARLEQASLGAATADPETQAPITTTRDRRTPPAAAPGVLPAGAVRGPREPLARGPVRSVGGSVAAVALVLLCVVALYVVLSGSRVPQPAAATPRPVASAPARPGSQPAGPAGTARAAAATPSTADCASMQMQAVVAPASTGHPVVQGLCYTLGGGTAWRVGCAPGFQAACNPSLQPVIDCLRTAGAQQHGAIDESNVLACDVPVGTSAGGT